MQRTSKRVGKGSVISAKFTKDDIDNLKKIMAKLEVNQSKALREAVRHCADQIDGVEVVKLREPTFEQAKKEISNYLKQKGKATNAEIADDLRLDIVLVNKVLNALWEVELVELAKCSHRRKDAKNYMQKNTMQVSLNSIHGINFLSSL